MGAPMRTARRISGQSGRRTKAPFTGIWPAAQATNAAWIQVEIEVAIPEPTAPSGGIWRSAPAHEGRSAPPKTSNRSSARLTTLASTADRRTARGAFAPCM